MHHDQLPAMEERLPAALATEFAKLTDEQREAASHQGSLVLRAGPGAGKTRALVARVGYLLATTSRHRSVAAITFTDAAATEVTQRLRHLGLPGGRRISSSTIHSFCMRHILLPYAHFTDTPLPDDFTVCTETQSSKWWDEAAYDTGLGELKSKDRTELSKQRRLLAAGTDSASFNLLYRATINRYRELLTERQALDFDAIPEQALNVLRSTHEVRKMVAARFPHIVVDEYQDLGPVLHAIVLELLACGVEFTVVGDPDQTMFGFQGASPHYLTELEQHHGFATRQLNVNWRSGSDLITAGLRVLDADRPYRAAPSRDEPGLVTEEIIVGYRDLDEHASRAVTIVQDRIRAGTQPEEIAVLYPNQGPLLTELHAAFEQVKIAYDAEKARKIPPGHLADFISDCTSRYLAGPLPGGANALPGAAKARTLMDLATLWHRRRVAAGLAIEEDTPRRLARTLTQLLDASPRPQPADDATDFLERLISELDLSTLAAASEDSRDHTAIQQCRDAAAAGLSLAEMAGARAPGRIVMTTYHSSKGREFDIVVLPGLVNKHIPYYGWSGPTQREMRNARRNFYVAFTRARHEVVLITGKYHTDRWGEPHTTRRSVFVDDILGTHPEHNEDR
ncbi:ATP-dependent helicase [Streptomyces parvulus]|uniref:ATP-dependent helicase n=1 Tax=Streptomyces parvulus TaxID=146923 RepID=UPI0033ACF692